MSTTASDSYADALRYGYSQMSWQPKPRILQLYPAFASYEMVKMGYKEYGFRPHNKQVGGIIASYKCSHLEAQRRFKLMLSTRRLLK